MTDGTPFSAAGEKDSIEIIVAACSQGRLNFTLASNER